MHICIFPYQTQKSARLQPRSSVIWFPHRVPLYSCWESRYFSRPFLSKKRNRFFVSKQEKKSHREQKRAPHSVIRNYHERKKKYEQKVFCNSKIVSQIIDNRTRISKEKVEVKFFLTKGELRPMISDIFSQYIWGKSP